MAETNFVYKQPGDRFNASDYMKFVESINRIERVLNVDLGLSRASIPSSNLAGNIPGSKIDPSSSLVINKMSVSEELNLNGTLLIEDSGQIKLKDGDDVFFHMARNSVQASDGSKITFLIDSSGKATFRGLVESDNESVLRGSAYISGGDISGELLVGGKTGLAINGATKRISVGQQGRIDAGQSYLSSTGIHFLQGSININDSFKVNSDGSSTISSGDFSGRIVSESGFIGGISITPYGLESSSFLIGKDGYVNFSDGRFAGEVEITSGQIVDASITGELSGEGLLVDDSGVNISKGSIRLGNGAFSVDNDGNFTATNSQIHGRILAESGLVTGTFTAGSVEMSPSGMRVFGQNGIKVDTGAIEVWDGEDKSTKVLTLGQYLTDDGSKNYGMLVTNSEDEKTFIVDRDGNVSIKGYIETESTSKIDGDITARTGNFYSVNVRDAMSILPGGMIKAGTSEITDTGVHLTSGSISLGDKFFVGNDGVLTASDVNLSGGISATTGEIAGILTIGARGTAPQSQLHLDGINGRIMAGGTIITNSGISITRGTINLGGGKLVATDDGVLVAQEANIRGHLEVESANILGAMMTRGAHIDQTGIHVTGSEGIVISNGDLTVVSKDEEGIESTLIRLGKFEDPSDASQDQHGLVVYNVNDRQPTLFINKEGSVRMKGIIEAHSSIFSGTISAESGTFGSGKGAITAGKPSDERWASGIFHGDGVGAENSNFWISSEEGVTWDNEAFLAGSAFFKGGVKIDSRSAISDGELVIEEGRIVAGDPFGARVEISYDPSDDSGGKILGFWKEDYPGAIEQEVFRIDKRVAKFVGRIEATEGSVRGTLTIGEGSNVRLVGSEESIKLIDREDRDRIVRLSSSGLQISTRGGIDGSWEDAITPGGVSASVIRDGYLNITDTQGSGASGIIIKKRDPQTNNVEERITISPDGIVVKDGSITIYSDKTGELLLGGGYLRVKGLDMGVVTSNNFVANGNFNMISEKYGLARKNTGEVFLGTAHSHGGAVSNPTYHYVGWPDNEGFGMHEVWTYDLQEDGTINEFNIKDIYDENFPNRQRVSFNPQWSVYHPDYDYCIVPNDACNFINVLDKDGNVVRPMLSWKGGLFGADYSRNLINGRRILVVCGDDIDRKRGPWDVTLFDVTDPDPHNWGLVGKLVVGEFPSRVVCDDKGYAYVTVSIDRSIYKININDPENPVVDKILSAPAPNIFLPIEICPCSYDRIFVGSVTNDTIFVIPTHFNTPIMACEQIKSFPYEGQRAMTHDIDMSPDGKKMFVTNASILDGSIAMIDVDPFSPTYKKVIDYIDGTTIDKLAIPEGAGPEDIEIFNYKSSTTMEHHPSLPVLYVTVTNRCAVSIIDYSSGEMIEVARIPTGSNPSGVSISRDGEKLYVPNHHYHTYPLGPNRVWAYDTTNQNYYCSPESLDTTQRFYHYNPAGMVWIKDSLGREKLWVANRASNMITIIDINDWENETYTDTVTAVGNKPYALKANHARTKVIVTNDDSEDRIDPDFITVIDIETKTIDSKIYVGDSPTGLEISSDDRYAYISCYKSATVQKVDLHEKKVVSSVQVGIGPRFLKIHQESLFVTCANSNIVQEISMDTMKVLNTYDCIKQPAQMAVAHNKLYIVNQGADCVQVLDLNTREFIKKIKVGSMPKAIGYNNRYPGVDSLYVGNAGEGSICVIDPIADSVSSWLMTGDSPEYITISEDGSKWFVSAHGPKDIVTYGSETDYFGDAYLDSNNTTHHYGAAYWTPNRSEWHRAPDNSLTGFSSVEFWPDGVLHDRQGYAQLSVHGMYDSFAQIEQDVYLLTNHSEGASDQATEVFELFSDSGYQPSYQLKEEIANYTFHPDSVTKSAEVVDAVTGQHYIENIHYEIDYQNSKIAKRGESIPSRKEETVSFSEDWSATLSTDLSEYNTIEMFLENDLSKIYLEGEDFTVDRINNKIALTENTSIFKKPNLQIVVRMKHLLKIRYYYHPKKRNYSDIVLSSDFFWRWPRPENQWVYMEVDELVPRFIIVDNDQITPWTPLGDGIEEEIRGLEYSAISDRAEVAAFSASDAPTSGSVHSLSSENGFVKLPSGDQFIEIDLGGAYYVNKISVTHPNNQYVNAKISISKDGKTWTDYDIGDGLNLGESYDKEFTSTFGEESYISSQIVRYVRSHLSGAENSWSKISVMGDWKQVSTYIFSRDTLWDSEGIRENFITLNSTNPSRFDGKEMIIEDIKFDSTEISLSTQLLTSTGEEIYSLFYAVSGSDENTIYELNKDFTIDHSNGTIKLTASSSISESSSIKLMMTPRVRYKTFYLGGDGSIDTRGIVDVRNIDREIQYVEGTDYILDRYHNTIKRVEDGSIQDGEKVVVKWIFVQEDLSHTHIAMPLRDPHTSLPVGPGTVAESDVTGAWIKWNFHNEYTADWYVGWVSDIGMGVVDVFMDDELIHSVSQSGSKTERFSQVSHKLTPGDHTLMIQQQQGKVNFDRVKLEDFQIGKYLNDQGEFKETKISHIIASPSFNPVELFTWHPESLIPGLTRKYLGKGSQTTSGAYESKRTDIDTGLPNNEVPIKYRVRFKTELKDRGTPGSIPDYGSGGELGDRESKFERGSVLITGVNMEKGINPTYYRTAPGADKVPGFNIEAWDESKPNRTGIQNYHLANGVVTSDKIKSFAILDGHINSNAGIQESKLSLLHPTHPHGNKNVLDKLSEAEGTLFYDGQPIKGGGGIDPGSDLEVEDLKVTGNLTVLNKPIAVHRKPLYGLAGDLQLETYSNEWQTIKEYCSIFKYATPDVGEGVKRYFRLYAVYGDNIQEHDNVCAKIRIITAAHPQYTLFEWDLPVTGKNPDARRDAYSPLFQTDSPMADNIIQITIQNENGTYSGDDKGVGLEWLEIIAYNEYTSESTGFDTAFITPFLIKE